MDSRGQRRKAKRWRCAPLPPRGQILTRKAGEGDRRRRWRGRGRGAALRTPTAICAPARPLHHASHGPPPPLRGGGSGAAPPPRWCRGRPRRFSSLKISAAGTRRTRILARRARRRGAGRGRLGRDVVRGAVDFDREADRGAVELEDVRADRMLAPEAQAPDLSAAHRLPEQNLRQCHGAPQRACALEGEERRPHAAKPNPHPRSGGGGPPKAVEGAGPGAILSDCHGRAQDQAIQALRTADLRSGAPPPPCFAWSPSPAARRRRESAVTSRRSSARRRPRG